MEKADIETFIIELISVTKKAPVPDEIKTRICYEVINPIMWGDNKKAAYQLCLLLNNIKRTKDGEIFILPEGVL